MKISETASTQTIKVVNSETPEKQEQSPKPPPVKDEDTPAVYWIGSEIVNKSIYDQYDTNKDGIISDAEKAAYRKAMGKNA